MVLGVRVHGDKVVDSDVKIDAMFVEVPVPAKLGIPLLCKRLSGTGGDDSSIRRNSIVRFMADADDGLAPMEWQYGGDRGPAPPVVLARRDGVPFSIADWHGLDSYFDDWLEAAGDADDGRSEVNARMLTPSAFEAFLRERADEFPSAFLCLRFPIGSIVTPAGLSMADLNGTEGEVLQFSRERVGVTFAHLPERGPIAIKPERLRIVRQAALVAEPACKRLATADEKNERGAELFRRDALAITQRFLDCMTKDEFPHHLDDLHLFGLGTSYQIRATEVLGVWQGGVKCGDVTEEALVDALCARQVQDYFKNVCYKFANSKQPNSTYAQALIDAKFAAVEWEDLG